MNKRIKVTYIKRVLAALLCCGVLIALLSGCGTDEEKLPFTVAVTELPGSLSPIYANEGLAEEFFLLAYDPLWRLSAAGEPVPCLVEDWSLSSDQLTWTIRLRQDVRFSDGEPLTARDVQFSYQVMMRESSLYAPYFEGISDIRCPDDHTVVIITSHVKGDMQYNPTPILPRHIWRDYEFSLWDFSNEKMVGSGPFEFQTEEEQSHETAWTFRAKENYHGEAAQIGEVSFVYYSTETGAARALSAGEVDAAMGLTDVQLTTLAEVPGVDLIQAMLPQTEVWALALNTRQEALQNVVVRQAIEYCTDREMMLSLSCGEAGLPGCTWASPGVEYYWNVANQRPFDKNTARTSLRAAGYDDLDGDGYVEDTFFREPLVLRLYSSSQDQWSSTVGTILVEDLEEIGIRVNWTVTDGAVEDKCGPKADWDICIVGWRGSVDASAAAMPFRTSDTSLTGWSSSTYDQVLSQLQTSMDQASTQNLAGQLQQIMYDECPYVVLGYHCDIQGVRKDAWTGYEDALAAAGGIFGIGSADVYMALAPVTTEE